jgi:hypothetical protein
MEVNFSDPSWIRIRELDPVCIDLLRQLPGRAQTNDPEITARLYPTPYDDLEFEHLEDWAEYVTPDLEQFSRSASDIVKQDLENLRNEILNEGSLEISIDHLNAWIHVLNQARIVMATRHNFSEETMEFREFPTDPDAAFDLFLMNFYGYLLELFVSLSQGEHRANPEES